MFLHRHTLNVSHLTRIVFEIVLDWAHHNTKIRAIVYKNYRNFRCLTGFTFFFWLTAMSVVHMNHWLTCCCVEDYGLMRALFDGTVCNMFWRVSKYDSCVQMEIMFGKKAWEWPNIWYLYPWMRSQFGFIIRYLITGIPFFLWSRFRHDILFSYWECPDPEDSDSFFLYLEEDKGAKQSTYYYWKSGMLVPYAKLYILFGKEECNSRISCYLPYIQICLQLCGPNVLCWSIHLHLSILIWLCE